MKHLITVLVALSLASCGYVKVYTEPWVDEVGQQRGGVSITTLTLFKEIYAAEAHSENLILRMNRSAIDEESVKIIDKLCELVPDTEGC